MFVLLRIDIIKQTNFSKKINQENEERLRFSGDFV